MKRGLTLIEILVIIAIIGIFSSAVFLSLKSAKEKAQSEVEENGDLIIVE